MILSTLVMFVSSPGYVTNIHSHINILDLLPENKISNYCVLCNIEKQKGYTYHCFSCNRCLDGFGRHSNFYLKCIGKKNIIISIINLFFTAFFFITSSACCLSAFIVSDHDLLYEPNIIPFMLNHNNWLYLNITKNILSIVIMIFSILSSSFFIKLIISDIKIAHALFKIKSNRQKIEEDSKEYFNKNKNDKTDLLISK